MLEAHGFELELRAVAPDPLDSPSSHSLLVNQNEAQRLGRGRALFLRRFVFSLLAMELSPDACRVPQCCSSSLTEVGACCGVSSASLLGSSSDVFVEMSMSEVFRVQGLRDLLTALATLP